MAFDGIVISAVVKEFKDTLVGGRIYKIYQPEADEINIIVKNQKETYRVLLSAGASLPLAYLTLAGKENPMTAPNFCMLLRKHIGNGRIVDIRQPNFERIIELEIEHLDEMGDLKRKRLVTELMGKHSNIIFIDENDMIIDSIKHVSAQISSVREVLPGRTYVFPPANDKISPFLVTKDIFLNQILCKPMSVAKAIFSSVTGFSKIAAEEICYRADADLNSALSTESLDMGQKEALWNSFFYMILDIQKGLYFPNIVYQKKEPIEFAAISLTLYHQLETKQFSNISEVLSTYYAAKDAVTRIRQKSADMRRLILVCIERVSKKYDLQLKQLKDTEKRDKYRIYGELLNTYGYEAKEGDKQIEVLNYYTNEMLTIPLDDTLTSLQNSQKYFAKYNKLKRTYEALTELVVETKGELEHLLSLQNCLEIAVSEADLMALREEMITTGYIKAKGFRDKKGNGRTEKSKPFHYMSSDGFHMYVGKNNLQNDEITFKLANGGDLWFHAKGMPGSHVIVRLNGEEDVPDTTYEEAARLAAFYSAGRTTKKVEIDYTKRSNLKKPPQAKPGFVIYHTNYSMTAIPDIEGIFPA